MCTCPVYSAISFNMGIDKPTHEQVSEYKENTGGTFVEVQVLFGLVPI